MSPFLSFCMSDEFCGFSMMVGYWAERILGVSLQFGWLEIAVGIILGRGEEE